MKKPFSPSADRNKDAILSVLKDEVCAGQLVLEIGSGTGQHACYFIDEIPQLIWQPTEIKANICVLRSWTEEQSHANLLSPKVLDVDVLPWPVSSADICYTCNTLHIISMQSVASVFKGSRSVLGKDGKLCVYGPFAIDGQHTSSGNEAFDHQLRESDPASGVRDLSQLDNIAQQNGFATYRSTPMPSNNLFVVWERVN